MPVLYVTEPGSVVRLTGRSLVVTAASTEEEIAAGAPKEKRLAEVEGHLLDGVALVGKTHMTADAVRFCLEEGIALSWMTRGGKLLGRTSMPLSRTGDLRLRQYEIRVDPGRRLVFARGVVAAKIVNATEVLEDVQRNVSGNIVLEDAIARLKESAASVQSCEAPDSLLGVEGTAARVYFTGLREAFRGDIPFPGRAKWPPPDPANALLSFGYVLLGNLLAGMLEARGLDPAIGFFHEPRSGRPSLALDVLEELRHPIVDRLALRMCNLRIMQPEMFEPDEERPPGVRMTREGMRSFFVEWEEAMTRPLREKGGKADLPVMGVLTRQVDRVADSLRSGRPYEPFLFGR